MDKRPAAVCLVGFRCHDARHSAVPDVALKPARSDLTTATSG